MPQERQEKRIDELPHLENVLATAKIPIEQDGVAYYVNAGQLTLPNASGEDF